jgi:hypothetical protein
MCNQLYFAVVPGLCDVSEVPDVCGLVQYTANGSIRTIKKAPWRDIDHPVAMYQYLMFNYIKAQYRRDSERPRAERLLENDRLEIFRRYVEDKADLRELGGAVGRKMGREIRDLQEKVRDLEFFEKSKDDANRDLLAVCNALGVNAWHDKPGKCIEAINQLKSSGGITLEMKQRIRDINKFSEALLSSIS